MKTLTRKLTLTLIAILGIASITNANVDAWKSQIEKEHGLRIERVVTLKQVPSILNGDSVRIRAEVNKNGIVTKTQSLEYTNENLASAYEYAVKQWRFEQKDNDYVVIIPIIASVN